MAAVPAVRRLRRKDRTREAAVAPVHLVCPGPRALTVRMNPRILAPARQRARGGPARHCCLDQPKCPDGAGPNRSTERSTGVPRWARPRSTCLSRCSSGIVSRALALKSRRTAEQKPATPHLCASGVPKRFRDRNAVAGPTHRGRAQARHLPLAAGVARAGITASAGIQTRAAVRSDTTVLDDAGVGAGRFFAAAANCQ
jgi:hypothetical protein